MEGVRKQCGCMETVDIGDYNCVDMSVYIVMQIIMTRQLHSE